MGKEHSYGLDWIDEDALYDVTAHVFANVIERVRSIRLQAPPDPFTIVAQAVLFGQDADSMMAFEKLRGINKTISNAVGNWHQAVLGLAKGWEDRGRTGGVVDLFVRVSEGAAPIAVEVKNRYNTIKASDEKELWDKLNTLAMSNGSKAYLVQIVPKTPVRYDRPWKVSGRELRETIRCCDGATAYAWAFGVDDALRQLYDAFPRILEDVLGKNSFVADGFSEYFAISMPPSD